MLKFLGNGLKFSNDIEKGAMYKFKKYWKKLRFRRVEAIYSKPKLFHLTEYTLNFNAFVALYQYEEF